MSRKLSPLWTAVAFGIIGTACSRDATSPSPLTIAADRQVGVANTNKDKKDKGPATYAVIGDVPYGSSALALLPQLIAGINGDPNVSRAIHVGDIKSGSTVCSDEWFQSISNAFATFADPLVYAIGDNEWTDCHRLNNGGYNPINRLDKIRSLFFANPGFTLGGVQEALNAQTNYPENQEWTASEAVFATFHVIGSNNGLSPWFGDRVSPAGETSAETSAREAEYLARNAANIAWLERTFALANENKARGVVLFLQADFWHPDDRAAGAVFTAHQAFLSRLSQLALGFRGPVLMIAGDSHDYRVDVAVPWMSTYYGVTSPPNLTNIIVDRSIEDDMDYLRLTIDPKSKSVFSWEQVFVPIAP
jgi:hypothetical protein